MYQWPGDIPIGFNIVETRMKIPHREVVDLVLQCVSERYAPPK